MDKETCIEEATRTAIEGKMDIAILDAPIETAEDPRGSFGYCPIEAVGILFKFGTLYATVNDMGILKYA